MLDRMIANWVYGGSLAGVLLLALAPLVTRGWDAALVLTFLALPVYMLHQLEEHDADRFRAFVNRYVGHGREVLTPADVFVVNVGLVWGGLAIAIYLAADLALGLGLIATYLMLVNAIAHIGQGIVLRRYNPGLVTAIVLFLPLSAAGLWAMAGRASLGDHVIGLGVAIAIHAALIAMVRRRLAGGPAPAAA